MYRPVRPSQAVEVERDGRWFAGELQAWRRDETTGGACVAFVLDAVAPGMQHLEWVPAERVRKSAIM